MEYPTWPVFRIYQIQNHYFGWSINEYLVVNKSIGFVSVKSPPASGSNHSTSLSCWFFRRVACLRGHGHEVEKAKHRQRQVSSEYGRGVHSGRFLQGD
jgi:hypothetical protein